jgi:hypothetical protein
MTEDLTFALTRGQHEEPFALLGPHVVTAERGPTVVVRAFLLTAESVTLQPPTTQVLPQQNHGVWELFLPGVTVGGVL